MDEKKTDFILLKCIKDVKESDNYSPEDNLGAEDYCENNVIMTYRRIGENYLKHYPDCFKTIKMDLNRWINLAKQRIKLARYALRGRDMNDPYYKGREDKIQKAEDLIPEILDNNANLNELLNEIFFMPRKRTLYWYDHPRDISLNEINNNIKSDSFEGR